MPGRKREADNAVARSWYQHMNRHSATCRCGHPKWRHMGLNEPACTFLGVCPCSAFASRRVHA